MTLIDLLETAFINEIFKKIGGYIGIKKLYKKGKDVTFIESPLYIYYFTLYSFPNK